VSVMSLMMAGPGWDRITLVFYVVETAQLWHRAPARFTGEPGPGRTPAASAEVALVVPMRLQE